MEALDQALGFKNAKNLLPVYRPWVGSGEGATWDEHFAADS